MSESQQITPAYVESLIEMVGRERVFEHAKLLGWSGYTPPLWVWHQICLDLIPSMPARGNRALQ
jgi:hypothetical protein